MSFGQKIASAFISALAIITLTTFVAAQDNGSTDKQTDKAQKERKFGRGGERGGRGMRGGDKRGGNGMHGLKNLDLTDAQKEQVKTIMESSKTTNEPLRQEMRSLMEKRRGGGELTETDRTRLGELKSRMKQSGEQNQNAILSILTAEQRQKFEQMKQENQKRREDFRERRQNRQTTPDKTDGQ